MLRGRVIAGTSGREYAAAGKVDGKGGPAESDDIGCEAADIVDGSAGRVVPVDDGVDGGIAMASGFGRDGDVDVGGIRVELGHGFVGAAGREDVQDFGDVE